MSNYVPLRRNRRNEACKYCGRTNAVVCYEECKRMKPSDFKFFTGVTQDQFGIIYELCGGGEVCSVLKYRYSKKTPTRPIVSDFTARDRLFMTLIRLRRGIPMKDLSFVCGVSLGFASECVYTWIRVMSLTAQKLESAMCVSAVDRQENKPKCFKPFPNLRMIIDSTEFKVEQPGNFEQQAHSIPFHGVWYLMVTNIPDRVKIC
ncbi:4-hydroxy-tetrahydrodipicolinate synthase [Frankliniella fusca]|uniref:4-hydroxy-tetrahydrodipicolinate synthase n=1 Tax=Frankliniella fusca TaxID=407009 RepID=A0AAE1GZ51_9NEOP|nr:4-hydroxy-tetrahydrodipicolinate synthase [Frankliniella fusca]